MSGTIELIEEAAKTLRASHPELSKERATVEVLAKNPGWYDAYVAEQRGDKPGDAFLQAFDRATVAGMVSAIRMREPELSEEAARVRVFRDHPELYAALGS